MSLVFDQDGIEAYSYYDGYLAGIYQLDGQKYFFTVMNWQTDQHDPPYPPGRIYDIWKVDEFPDPHLMDKNWWHPEREADGQVTEFELNELYIKEEEDPDGD